MASLFSTTSGVAVVDTRTRPGTITLPLTTQIPNRYLQIKDIYGAFAQSSLTLSTQAGERFDDGTTTKTLTDPYSFFTLYAASTTRWAQLGGTQTIQQTMSSLIVSSLTIGSGSGWLQLPPIQTIYASTTITQAQALYSLSSYFGGTSTATTLEYWGLFGNYNNTVLAEVSTGAGTQELLLFKGSSSSDRVRVQTTGTFVVETGVSARLWNDNTTATLSNATPAFIINASSNVGIQTASPGATLDVAGTSRGITLSSLALNISSLNGAAVPTSFTGSTNSLSAGTVTASIVSTLALNLSSLNGQPLPTASLPSTVSTSYATSFTTGFLTASTINYVNVAPSTFNMWVAAGNDSTQNNRLQYSLNGINWTASSSNGFIGRATAVAWGGNMWVALGQDTGNLGRTINYSYDGITWFSATGAFDSQGLGLAWNGRMWVAVGFNNGAANQKIKYSYDGINWSNSSGATFSGSVNGVAWNGNMWVALGFDSTANNTIKYSYDGINWSNSSGTGFTGRGYSAAWNGLLWVAVGQGSTPADTIKYSYDGINWSNAIGGLFNPWGLSVAWNGSMFIAVGNSAAQYSSDGITWYDNSSLGYGNAIAWDGTVWQVVSGGSPASATIRYSYDGFNWTNSSGTGFSTEGLGVAYSSNLTPAYRQSNFSILPQNIPLFLTSTNTFFVQPSSLTINNTIKIDTLKFVGINCNVPRYTLDVNGSLNISSLFIQTSSFQTFFPSTVMGLGTAGYLSSLSLVSTTAGITTAYQTAGFLSTPVLVSTVTGLGSSGYVSTFTLNAAISSFSTALGSVGGGGGGNVLDTQIASTLQYSGSFSSIKFGYNAGFTGQGLNAIAIGNESGNYQQTTVGIAIGYQAGMSNQQTAAVGLGQQAGFSNQGFFAIAIGHQAGYSNQSNNAVAIGCNSGYDSQQEASVAIGQLSGYSNQGSYSVGVGWGTGWWAQGYDAVAIGDSAGYSNQGNFGTAVGPYAGQSLQGENAVALGYGAGNDAQGSNSIAIGHLAGSNSQAVSSIIINATGSPLDSSNAGLYIAPLRNIEGSYNYTIGYDSNTYEMGMIQTPVNGGVFTLTPSAPANISFSPLFNLVTKIANGGNDDLLVAQEKYPYCFVTFTTDFQTLDFQTINLIRATNQYYGLLFHSNGYVYVQVDGSATPSLGLYNSNDAFSIQMTPTNVYWYKNQTLVYEYGTAPVASNYYLQMNLRSVGDTIFSLGYGGTTSPTLPTSSFVYFNTPLPITVGQLTPLFTSTVEGLGSAGYISTMAGGGGGAIPYVSAFTVSTSVLALSTLISYSETEAITVSSSVSFLGKMTNNVELNGKGNINVSNTIRGLYYMITSTLGTDDVQFTTDDYGIKFVYTTSNFNNVNLPNPALLPSGWNVVIANSRGSTSDLNLYQNCNYITNITAGSYYPFCTDSFEYFPF